MKKIFNLNDYLTEEGYYDFDKMNSEINEIMRIENEFAKRIEPRYRNREIFEVVMDYQVSEEYKKFHDINREREEEKQKVDLIYNEKIKELQNKCEHYIAKVGGSKLCLKCKKVFE